MKTSYTSNHDGERERQRRYSDTHCNGLKLDATNDGEPAVGPSFTRYYVDCGLFDMIHHSMQEGEQELILTVGTPVKKHDNLDDPTARIAYIGIGGVEC